MKAKHSRPRIIGYEILRLGARYRRNPIVKAIMWPGILVQMITTKQPTPDMIEVAIVSMEEALKADGEPLPSESGLVRDPLELPGTAVKGETAVPVSSDPPLPEA